MFKLLRYLKKYWFYAILAPLFMLLEVLMDMVLTSYMQKMVDFGIQTNNINNVINYGLIMIAVLFAGVVFGVLSGVFTNLTSFKFANDLRVDLYKKIMSLSIDQTDDFKTGSLVTRVTNDVTQIQNMISMALRSFVRALSFFVLGIVFVLSISSDFGVVLLVLLPLEIIVLLLFMKFVFPIFTVIQKKLDRVNTVVHENVSGARVVKSFIKEDYETERFNSANDDYTSSILKANKIAAFLMPLLTLLVFGGQMVIYYLGGTAIIDAFKSANFDNLIMVGQITQAITYLSMIFMSIIMLGMTFVNMARAFASAKRINEILDAGEDIIYGDLDLNNVNLNGKIEFKNVSFKYPENDKYVLSNLNFTINPGETIAIVGATGCGKSTLVNLIVRLYDVSDGEILIDNINVKEFKKNDLTNFTSICLQKAELFADTIANNIRFGKPNATMDEVVEAAKMAQIDDFIVTNDEGYDEMITEKGTSLSGGQKQRISIARAIIKKPKILIFDDSTSALDLMTEASLYEALNKSLSSTTKIVVAQRIATAKNADKIIVLDNSTIAAFDTHDNLMENCDIYKDIYMSQLKKEEN